MFRNCTFVCVMVALSGVTSAGVISVEPVKNHVAPPQSWLADSLAALQRKRQPTPVTDEVPTKLTLIELALQTGDPAKASRQLENVATELSHHPDFYRIAGQLALANNRISSARLNFRRALKLAADCGWSKTRRAKCRQQCELGLATIAEQREQWDVALQLLKSTVEIDTSNISNDVRMRLARALVIARDFGGAFSQAQQATKNEKPYVAALRIARLASSTAQHDDARSWYRKACQVSKDDVVPEVAYARWLMRMGDYPRAEKHLGKALKIRPTSGEVLLAKADLSRHQKNFHDAEEQLRALLKIQPDNLRLRDALAIVMVSQDIQSVRQEGYQLAVENAKRMPKNLVVLSTLGRALQLTGHPQEAEAILQNATSNGRMTPDAAFYLAEVHVHLGTSEDSVSLLEKAMKTDGIFFHRSEARTLLKQLKSHSEHTVSMR